MGVERQDTEYFGQDDFPFKLLVEFLSEDNSDPNLVQEEWNRLEKRLGEKIYPEILYLLTQMEFKPDEARRHWYKIIEHREDLNRRLGRDAGLRVALCDYFTNINPKLKNLVFVEVQLFMQKERSALVDELTGLYNRRFFNQVVRREVEHAKRFEQPFSLLMLDLDNFKNYNDMYGHQAGDKALTEVAQVLNQTARAIDHVVRFGGEEFVLILPQVDKEQALLAAERHRHAVEAHSFSGQEKLPLGNLTVTIGVATFPTDAQEAQELLQQADDALYQGKKDGRNRTVLCVPNKRHHTRHPLRMEMMFRLREAADQSFQQGTTQDISLGGLKCQTDLHLDLGRQLDVFLSTPNDDFGLQLPARTVRLTKNPEAEHSYYLGLSFELNSEEEENALRILIEDEASTLH